MHCAGKFLRLKFSHAALESVETTHKAPLNVNNVNEFPFGDGNTLALIHTLRYISLHRPRDDRPKMWNFFGCIFQ